jgi:hypothetical protein
MGVVIPLQRTHQMSRPSRQLRLAIPPQRSAGATGAGVVLMRRDTARPRPASMWLRPSPDGPPDAA